MPHISIKMYPGRSEETKKELARKARDFFADEMKAEKKYFSVSIEEIKESEWNKKVDEVVKNYLYIKSNF